MKNRYTAVRTASLIGAAGNIFLAVIKVLFGYLGQSSALLADGLHSFSDVLTDVLVLIAAKYGAQKADAEHPYGHARIETFASFLLATFLILVGLIIAWEAGSHILNHESTAKPDLYVLGIAAFSVVLNEVIYRYMLRIANRVKSDLLKVNALHRRSDSAASLVVLIAVIGSFWGLWFLDQIAAIIIAFMIVKMGLKIGWNNAKELVDTGLSTEEIEAIKKVIMSVSGVCAVHELRTRRMAGQGLLDVHIIVDSYLTVSEGHHIAEFVMWSLKQKISSLEDVVVHIDSENDEGYSSTSKLPLRADLIPLLETAWQGLPGSEQIRDIRLHYLRGFIKVELVLPMELARQYDPRALQARYFSVIEHLKNISQCTLLFDGNAKLA